MRVSALGSYYIKPRLTDCIYLFVCPQIRSGAYVRYFRGPEGRRRRLVSYYIKPRLTD